MGYEAGSGLPDGVFLDGEKILMVGQVRQWKFYLFRETSIGQKSTLNVIHTFFFFLA